MEGEAVQAPDFWGQTIEWGQISFTPASLLLGAGLLLLVLVMIKLLRWILLKRFFPRFDIHPGLGNAYATLTGYGVFIIALAFILPVSFHGFNWATLSVLLGAISFGVGFGLRNIADNFVSGLIILLERPVKVGDRVTVDELSGMVTAIRARSTTVRTNDNIEVIVPNSRFIAESVINWSHSDNRVRFRIPVGVHYKSEVPEVKRVLEAAAAGHSAVLTEPGPSAKFIEFGDSSLNFELWVWTTERTMRPTAFRSELNYLIWDHLKAAGIEIPYPQRDLYIKELPEKPSPVIHD
jgi:small-conductance mechanosensitive channel